jgi:hypothetical protein
VELKVKHKWAFWVGLGMLFSGYGIPLAILLILYAIGVFDRG